MRIGIVGCGRRGLSHAELFDAHPLADVAAVCDPFENSRSAAAARFVANEYSAVTEMLASEHLDAVVVAAPAHLNTVTALPIIESGIPTLLEKPPGLNVADVEGLAEASVRSGGRVMVGFDRRFNPFVRAAQSSIAMRGQVTQIVAEFHKDIRDFTQDRRFDETLLDRLLLESPIHSVDLITHLADSPVSSVRSVVNRVGSDYRDLHAALVEFESGCVAQFTACLTAGGRLERYEIHGNEVSAYLEGVHSGSITEDGQSSDIVATVEGKASTHLQDEYFINAVASGDEFGKPAATLESSIATLDLAEKILAGTR